MGGGSAGLGISPTDLSSHAFRRTAPDERSAEQLLHFRRRRACPYPTLSASIQNSNVCARSRQSFLPGISPAERVHNITLLRRREAMPSPRSSSASALNPICSPKRSLRPWHPIAKGPSSCLFPIPHRAARPTRRSHRWTARKSAHRNRQSFRPCACTTT